MDNFNLKKFLGEKSLLNENAPGYDTRKFGEALPTLESVKAAHEAKEDDKKEIKEVMSNIMQYWDRTDTMINDLREFILAAKDAGGEDLVREIADALKLMTNYAMGEYKKGNENR